MTANVALPGPSSVANITSDDASVTLTQYQNGRVVDLSVGAPAGLPTFLAATATAGAITTSSSGFTDIQAALNLNVPAAAGDTLQCVLGVCVNQPEQAAAGAVFLWSIGGNTYAPAGGIQDMGFIDGDSDTGNNIVTVILTHVVLEGEVSAGHVAVHPQWSSELANAIDITNSSGSGSVPQHTVTVWPAA